MIPSARILVSSGGKCRDVVIVKANNYSSRPRPRPRRPRRAPLSTTTTRTREKPMSVGNAPHQPYHLTTSLPPRQAAFQLQALNFNGRNPQFPQGVEIGKVGLKIRALGAQQVQHAKFTGLVSGTYQIHRATCV